MSPILTPTVDTNITLAAAVNADLALTPTVDVNLSFGEPTSGEDGQFKDTRRDFQDFEDVSGEFTDFGELKEAS